MLISCQNCATSYQVDPSSLGPTGRSVRCVRCQKVWFAANPMALAEIAQAYRAEVGALAPPPAGLGRAPAASRYGSPRRVTPARDPPCEHCRSDTWDAPPPDLDAGATPPQCRRRAAEESSAHRAQPLASVDAPALAPADAGRANSARPPVAGGRRHRNRRPAPANERVVTLAPTLAAARHGRPPSWRCL